MVGPGGDHQAPGPGVQPPEHGPRQQKALAHRPPGRHDRDRAPGDRLANLDLLRPEPAAEDLFLKPRGIVAARLEQHPHRPQLRRQLRDRREQSAAALDLSPRPGPRPARRRRTEHLREDLRVVIQKAVRDRHP